jgi:hypothetical protein
MPYRRLLPVLLVLPATVAALEVQGQPPDYLAMNYRAEWRMKPLGEVLEDLQRAIEKPVVATAAVQALVRQVALTDERKAPLRETLERLEAVQDLRFTAEPLRLRVETVEDARARRRRLIEIDLSEYMLFSPIRDFPGPELGFGFGSSGGALFGGADPAAGGAPTQPDPGVPGAEEVLDWLKRLSIAGESAVSTRTGIFVHATPEEEVALRKALDELLGATVRQTAWRITWGIAVADAALSTGIVPAAEAARTAAGLAGRTVETLHALAGQRVHAGRVREHSWVGDVEIVAGRMDPVAEVVSTGRNADLRPLPGRTLTLLEYRLDWVEPLPATPVALSQGPAAPRPPDKDGTTMPSPPGEQLTVSLPALWSWQPVGDVVLPHGHGLVLCAEHAQGRAVVVVEEVR